MVQLVETLQNIYRVLQHADKSKVLDNQIVLNFYEENPGKITEKYFEYLDDHKDVIKESISHRFNQGNYDSIYKLYHDIKISCAVLISDNEMGSDKYLKIDDYYKFSTELILQEAYRLDLKLEEFKQSLLTKESQLEVSEFSKTLAQDFNKISTSIQAGNNEALFVLSGPKKNIPLFSSLSKKSELDPNDYHVPKPIKSMKVLPHLVSVSGPSLGFISNNDLKQQVPDIKEITRDIFHPNWHAIPCVPWLTFGPNKSFIPLIDETISAINSRNKGKVYYEQVGLPNLIKLQKKVEENNKEIENKEEETKEEKNEEESKEETKEENKEEKTVEPIIVDEKDDEKDKKKINGEKETKVAELEEEEEDDDDDDEEEDEEEEVVEQEAIELGKHSIDVAKILQWAPGHKFESDELEQLTKGTEQQYVNKLLIDLNKLRYQRYSEKVSKPQAKEKQIYFKIKRLLQVMVHNTKPRDLINDNDGIKLSRNIPVLGMNYPGLLQAPIPLQYNNDRFTSSRLPAMNSRSYKKRR